MVHGVFMTPVVTRPLSCVVERSRIKTYRLIRNILQYNHRTLVTITIKNMVHLTIFKKIYKYIIVTS